MTTPEDPDHAPGDAGNARESGRRPPPPAAAPGPVPVRDLMKTLTPEPEPAAGTDSEPRWDSVERGFDNDEGTWIVRGAGAGAYGTGPTGTARLVAVHFFRADAPGTPVREALVPAGVFPHLAPEELRDLYDRATPIELDR